MLQRTHDRLEGWLETERDQLFLWVPVALGLGVATWFTLADAGQWSGWLVGSATLAAAGLLLPRAGRLRSVLLWFGLLAALGLALAWWRAERIAAPVLARPVVTSFQATVLDRTDLVAKDAVRLIVAPAPAAKLPLKIRVTVDPANLPAQVRPGAVIALRARLIGPQGPSVPGGFDFSRAAWFQQLGAVGKAMGPVQLVTPAPSATDGVRDRLTAHVRAQVAGSAGGIAAAFATGDRGGIAPQDETAMRASGLTHLLSISGLHVTAVVGAAMFLALRLFALSPWLALRWPLVTLSAAVGAAVGVGYTLLTGAEVPTIRSCIAALLVMIGIALGRDAITLRLVAAGAIFVLLLWPEALVGPSFQLSFAAITSIVALHEQPRVKAWFARRDEGAAMRLGRGLAALLLTGIAVELTLAPIALFHFHKSGVYGALANIVAIPLTTFVTMPLEALALLFDLVGLGAPFWWLTGLSLDALLGLARAVAALPMAQTAVADIPLRAFALMVGGGVWLLLWSTRVRYLGLAPVVVGALIAVLQAPPDLIVTSDGKHLAVRDAAGRLATLRPRAGEYVRSVLGERAGSLEPLADLDDSPDAACTADLCRVDLPRDNRTWRVLATRSPYFVDRPLFARECAAADIVVSDRRLPGWCRPRWFRADAALLRQTGGLAVDLSSRQVAFVTDGRGAHPWVSSVAAVPPAGPARAPDRRRRSAADAARLPDRAAPAAPPDGNI